MNVRASAASVLENILLKGRSLSEALPEESANYTDARDKALLQAICYGVCRHYFRLDAIAKKLLQKPFKQKDLDLYLLILIGIYQLAEMRIPDYAAISETVSGAKYLKKIWAKNLLNGVLREYQRRADEFSKIDPYSHPKWLMAHLQTHYPERSEEILRANNAAPPMSLRVNQQKLSREKFLENLSSAKIIPETSSGVVLSEPMPVEKIPGFLTGEVSVQDGAAQLAAEILAPQSGEYILDACAAPGGKTAHLLELAPKATCVAIDRDAERLAKVKENLQRLDLQANCLIADAGHIETWWDGKPFDRILLDAPCSASGVVRRHPDIKLLRRLSDIPNFAKEQYRLLTALWPVLKPGGLLLYATCSIFPEENEQVLQQFIAETPDAKEEVLSATWGLARTIGRQILPGMHGMDGFYYATLRKC